MKRITMLSLSMALAMSLSACGSAAVENSSSTAATTTASQTTEEQTSEVATDTETTASAEESDSDTAESAAEETESSGKVLVVYYSATSSTERAANAIAEATSGDLFTIEPVEPYTSDDLNWTNSDSRVSIEHDNPDQRTVELVSTSVDNWDSYDTVFVGYPIWWGIAAWPVDGFITANDFTGKTVIPFCTSASSGLGDSRNLLAEMAGTGNWLEGERFSSGESTDTIAQWATDVIDEN